MIVTTDLLKTYNLYDKLPQNFKDIDAGQKYLFYYNVDEDDVKIYIYEDSIIASPNIYLYRDLSRKMKNYKIVLKIGFLSKENDSRDGLFYLFLRTYNSSEQVDNFIRYTKTKDEEIDLNISMDANNDISSSSDISRLMGYYCKSRIQIITFVYDMVNAAYINRLSKRLYGNALKRIVNLVKYEAGVLLEIGGDLRYMVIGTNAALPEIKIQKLDEAKNLLRKGYNQLDIYTKTGWLYSTYDGKWRTNLSDSGAYISDTFLIDYDGGKIYVPEGHRLQDVISLIAQPHKINSQNYYGRLGDVLIHPELYEVYPDLADLPFLYYKNDKLPDNSNTFYFATTNLGGYIVMKGNENWGSHLSTLLHETQHAIQNKEGFARGGNYFLAQFVASVGAESVRTIFSTINYIKKLFKESFDNQTLRGELITILQEYKPLSPKSKPYYNHIIEVSKDAQSFSNQIEEIVFYLVIMLGYENNISENSIISYLISILPVSELQMYDIFNNLTDGFEKSRKYREYLQKDGISEEDIGTILQKNYENLYGELESRSVQTSRNIPIEFRNYFSLTSWENTPERNITVIDQSEKIVNVKEVNAAVEEKNGEYVLHFQKSNTCLPYLHELGHIVHDGLKQLGHANTIIAEFRKQVTIDSVEEFFVTKFIGYLKSRIDDENLKKDLSLKMVTENSVIYGLLDEFFMDNEITQYLEYLRKLIDLPQ